MDGTLLMDQQNVAEDDKKAIKEAVEKGVIVAITTGRIYDCARMYSDTIGLKTPIIASNGAYIGGVNDEEIYNEIMGNLQSGTRDIKRRKLNYELYTIIFRRDINIYITMYLTYGTNICIIFYGEGFR